MADRRRWYLGRSVSAGSEQLYFYRQRVDPIYGIPVKEILDITKCEEYAERVRLSVNVLLAFDISELQEMLTEIESGTPPTLADILSRAAQRKPAPLRVRAKGA